MFFNRKMNFNNKFIIYGLALWQVSLASQNISRSDVEKAIQSNRDASEIFNGIYYSNYWSDKESVSGGGSTLETTAIICKRLPELIKALNVQSILDAPCGDFNWMRTINLDVQYTGIEIVQDLVTFNQFKYGNKRRNFKCLNLIKDSLPYSDLILCKDCLAHLSFNDAISILKNFKNSGAKYLLVTTHIGTDKNIDINTGHTSPYNLELPPFNLPKPILLLEETSAEQFSRSTKKCLGLWAMQDINI